MEKKCTKCKEVKSLDEFNNRKDTKDKKQYSCKDCKRNYSRDYSKKNTEKIKQKNIKYRENNKEKEKKRQALYYKNNKDKVKERQKIYIKKNKTKLNLYKKNYRINNKDKIKEYYKKNKGRLNKKNILNTQKRLDTDPLFKLGHRIRTTIYLSIKRLEYSKKTKTYNILKCDYDFFMQWLNGVASNGYTYGIGDLHLDHVIPISLAETEDEVILLNHYSNYQLLSADENLAKSNLYVNPVNLARVLEHHPNPDKIREIHARL